MSTMPPYPTGPVIDAVLEYLESVTENVLLGDGIKPSGGGWDGGQPGKGTFHPYAVLDFASATVGGEPTLRDRHGDWSQVVTLTSFGGSRAQATFSTDSVREVLGELQGIQVVGFKIADASYTSLGGAVRDDATDPPTWRVVDAAALRLLRA